MGMAAHASSAEDRTLFARHEHGGYPVRVHRFENNALQFEVLWPTGPTLYGSGRGLLRALYGNHKAPNLTVDQYFRLKEVPPSAPLTVFDLFPVVEPLPNNVLPLRPRAPSQPRARVARAEPTDNYKGATTLTMFAPRPVAVVSPARVKPAKVHLAVAAEPVLGIDIDARAHEVRKILFKGFSSSINRHKLDQDDVLQEVYKGLMARNRGTCPFDPRKSSFGHYVHMVAACVLSNLIRKKKRQDENEQVGVHAPGGQEEFGGTVDAALAARSDRNGGTMSVAPDEAVATSKAVTSLLAVVGSEHASLAQQVIPMLLEGKTRTDIVRAIGREDATRALAVLQAAGARWATSF